MSHTQDYVSGTGYMIEAGLSEVSPAIVAHHVEVHDHNVGEAAQLVLEIVDFGEFRLVEYHCTEQVQYSNDDEDVLSHQPKVLVEQAYKNGVVSDSVQQAADEVYPYSGPIVPAEQPAGHECGHATEPLHNSQHRRQAAIVYGLPVSLQQPIGHG